MIVERRKATRNEYINQVADWLPENRGVHLEILRRNSEGRLDFYKDDQETFTIKNNQTKKEIHYHLKKHTWSANP